MAGDLVLTAALDLSGLEQFSGLPGQLNFALSHAMNKTAKMAEKAAQDDLPNHFTLRNKWTRGGIRFFQAATKKRLTVRVGSISDYLRAHETGDSRPASKQRIGAVPLAARSPKTAMTPRADWPLRLIRRGLAFRPGIDGARAKKGKKRSRVKPPPLQAGQVVLAAKKSPLPEGTPLWYVARDADVHITSSKGQFLRAVATTFDERFGVQLGKSIAYELKTRRKR